MKRMGETLMLWGLIALVFVPPLGIALIVIGLIFDIFSGMKR